MPFPLDATCFIPGQACGGTIVTKDWSDQNNQTVTTDTEVTRIVLGLNGSISETWSWEAYFQFGETTRDQIGDGYATNWRYYMATDAVINPANGQPICRAVLTGQVPDPNVDPSLIQGCLPLNVFGNTAASAGALNYAFADLTEANEISQDVYAGTISGQLWKGWGAGGLMGAFGLEYRTEDLVNNAGDLPRAQRTDFSLQYGDSFAGNTDVKEAFAEFEMPFLRDLPGAQLLTANIAGRRSEYTNTDEVSGQSGDQAFTLGSLRPSTTRSTGCGFAAADRRTCARRASASCTTRRAFRRAASSATSRIPRCPPEPTDSSAIRPGRSCRVIRT